MRRARIRCFAWLALTLAALACARAQSEPATPPQAPPPAAPSHQPVTDLDALEHDLEVAAARLEDQLDKKRREPVAAGELDEAEKTEKKPAQKNQPQRPGAPPAGPQPIEPEAGAERQSRTEPAGQLGSPCDVACRAFSSMRRSATRICELAGAGHERCTRAKTRLADAERKIANAGCECKKRDVEKLMSSL